MPTNIVMPQMGESVAEGTITKWLKKEGEFVRRDEPLFEISTDKVDTEIPSPVEGILQKILLPEGAKVPINTVVATIAEAEVVGAGSSARITEVPQAAASAAPAQHPPPRTVFRPLPERPAPLGPKAVIHDIPRPTAPLWAPGKVSTEAPTPKSDLSRCALSRDFDDLVYCIECGAVYAARIVLGSGDAVVPERVHGGKDCRLCRRNRYALVRARGDLGFLREK